MRISPLGVSCDRMLDSLLGKEQIIWVREFL